MRPAGSPVPLVIHEVPGLELDVAQLCLSGAERRELVVFVVAHVLVVLHVKRLERSVLILAEHTHEGRALLLLQILPDRVERLFQIGKLDALGGHAARVAQEGHGVLVGLRAARAVHRDRVNREGVLIGEQVSGRVAVERLAYLQVEIVKTRGFRHVEEAGPAVGREGHAHAVDLRRNDVRSLRLGDTSALLGGRCVGHGVAVQICAFRF